MPHHLTGNGRVKEMVSHQQQKGLMQASPRFENRKTVPLFPMLINESSDRNSQTIGKSPKKVSNALAPVSGYHIKVICSGLYGGADDPFDQGYTQNGDKRLTFTLQS